MKGAGRQLCPPSSDTSTLFTACAPPKATPWISTRPALACASGWVIHDFTGISHIDGCSGAPLTPTGRTR
jgi:hypothetical protein